MIVEYKNLHIDEDWFLIQTVETTWINAVRIEHRKYWLPVWIDIEWLKRIE